MLYVQFSTLLPMPWSKITVQAKQDLKQIVDRIARDNPGAARRLAAEIKRKAKATADFPEAIATKAGSLTS